MARTDRRVVSVFGSGETPHGHAEYALAEGVGRELGRLGCAVATGGYGGAMEAVSRGAKAAGAAVLGVTCRLWANRPNPYVDHVVETADLYERLRTLIDLGSTGYVVLPGGTGTLLELAGVWEMVGKGLARSRPIVCVGEYWRGLVELIARAKPEAGSRVRFVGSPEQLTEHFPPA